MSSYPVESAEIALPVATTSAQRAEVASLHVLHVIEALGPGGAERLLHTNLKYLEHYGVRSTVMTVFDRAMHWRGPIEDLGIPVISLNCKSSRDLLTAVPKLRRWLGTARPDLVHSHLWGANVISRVAGALAGVPVISSIHNPDHERQAWHDGADVKLSKRRIVQGLDRWTAHLGCTRMIAVSNYVRESTNRNLKYRIDKIDLLYNPFDTELFKAPPQKTRAEMLRELSLPSDSRILLNVARVSPQKGLIYALRALPAVLENYPTAHLVSVGVMSDPKLVAQMRAEAKQLGVESNFHLIGPRRDIVDFLRSCDVFVFPSLYEGLGIALIEAMASGCACVASAAGPIPEFVEHERNGLLVSPEDHEKLAEAICRILGSPDFAAQLGSVAKETAFDRFEPETAAIKLAEIYRSVMSGQTQKYKSSDVLTPANGSFKKESSKTMNISQTQNRNVIDHFNRLSVNKDWSRLYTVTDGTTYHFQVRRDRVLELLPAKLGRVLDIGCGPGVMVEAVLSRGGRFEGRDLAPEMINEGRDLYGDLADVNFEIGNVEELDAPDESYDQVIAMAVIEYLKTADRAMSEIARVLKPGGIAIITVPKRIQIDKLMVGLTWPFRRIARMLGLAHADLLPRLCFQPDELDEAAKRAGLVPEGGAQYNYTPVSYPWTRLAPQLTMRLNLPFERWHQRRDAATSFFAHGYIGRYRRP